MQFSFQQTHLTSHALIYFADKIREHPDEKYSDLCIIFIDLFGNKICLNVGKAKLFFFKSLTKQIDSDLHLTLNGKRLNPTDSLKYSDTLIGKNLNWHHQIKLCSCSSK